MPIARSTPVARRLRQLFIATGILSSSLLLGMLWFMFMEDLGFWDAFYMTVITISTVGMNETERRLSEWGRIFLSFYIIFNFSVFAYFVSVITKYLFEGELREIFQSYMNTRDANRMKDHTIVCGFGKNGSKACEELFRNEVALVVVDLDLQHVPKHYTTQSNVFLMEGDATIDETLVRAGVRRAKTIITALPKDADNVFVTLTARELNPAIKIVARAVDESAVPKLQRAGAHHVVMPDAIGGMHMANLVTKPEVVEFLGMLNGVGNTDLVLDEIRVSEMKPEFLDKTIRDLDIRNMTGVNIIGFKDSQDGFIFNPTPDTAMEEGDVIIILGTPIEIRTFRTYCMALDGLW
jgi:voltage-gated potassium channel